MVGGVAGDDNEVPARCPGRGGIYIPPVTPVKTGVHLFFQRMVVVRVDSGFRRNDEG